MIVFCDLGMQYNLLCCCVSGVLVYVLCACERMLLWTHVLMCSFWTCVFVCVSVCSRALYTQVCC